MSEVRTEEKDSRIFRTTKGTDGNGAGKLRSLYSRTDDRKEDKSLQRNNPSFLPRIDAGWEEVMTGWSQRTTNVFASSQGKAPQYLTETIQTNGQRKVLPRQPFYDHRQPFEDKGNKRGALDLGNRQGSKRVPESLHKDNKRGNGGVKIQPLEESEDFEDGLEDRFPMDTVLEEVEEEEALDKDETKGRQERIKSGLTRELFTREGTRTQELREVTPARLKDTEVEPFKDLLQDINEWRRDSYITKITLREIQKVFPTFLLQDEPQQPLPVVKGKRFLHYAPPKYRHMRLTKIAEAKSVEFPIPETRYNHPLLSTKGHLISKKPKKRETMGFQEGTMKGEEDREASTGGESSSGPNLFTQGVTDPSVREVFDTFNISMNTKLPDLLHCHAVATKKDSAKAKMKDSQSLKDSLSLPTLQFPTHTLKHPGITKSTERRAGGFRPIPKANHPKKHHHHRHHSVPQSKDKPGAIRWNKLVSLSLSNSLYLMRDKEPRHLQ